MTQEVLTTHTLDHQRITKLNNSKDFQIIEEGGVSIIFLSIILVPESPFGCKGGIVKLGVVMICLVFWAYQ